MESVSESHEPSYYEIALTNRQVVVAFVILLICLLSAFFSGVWIGRESTAQAQERLASNLKPPEAKKEGQNLQELEFFDAQQEPALEDEREESPAPPPSSPADTTLLEDFAGSGTPAGKTAPPPPIVEPEESAEPAADPEPDRRANRRNRGKAAEPEDAAPAPRVREQPAIPKGSVVIQVFSSQDRSQAEKISKRLTGGGQKAYLSPVEVGGHTMYRVRIGPFGSRGDAQKVAEKVRKDYKLDTWVTE